MRTVRTKIYSFNELSKESQAIAIDKMREINTEHDDWYECIFEGFKETIIANEYEFLKDGTKF